MLIFFIRTKSTKRIHNMSDLYLVTPKNTIKGKARRELKTINLKGERMPPVMQLQHFV